jgi:ADP-L-glycero-D-manno-heptose 6-epimerase
MVSKRRDFVYVKDIIQYTIRSITTAKKIRHFQCGIRSGSHVLMILSLLSIILWGSTLKRNIFDNPYSFYQPHTEADMSITFKVLRCRSQYTLEQGILDYFQSGLL